MTTAHLPFWERPEIVERFASREPDHRLEKLVASYARPGAVRVLDLGCAGGRNTLFLVRRGFGVHAVDASKAMVEATRRKLAEVLGRKAAARVREGRMGRLDFEESAFDLIVALGVFHAARSEEEWDGALREAHRLLIPGGRLLVADHTPEFDPEGTGLAPVAGHPRLFDGAESGRSYLVHADDLDREMAMRGFHPWVPTETARVKTEKGRRVTANGLYARR